ncbi:MAG TPA: hypothetical protein VN452_04190 [Longilinea sp.]|nr:hypothetical protein [Longilinea sp.]
MNRKSDVLNRLGLFVLARLILYLTLPLEGLHGYGDFVTFFSVTQIPGWPFLNYWVEFPPVFPFLSEILMRVSGAQLHVYTYLLLFVLLAADAGNLYFFQRLASHLWNEENRHFRIDLYTVILIALPYSWWYFDPLAVLFLLAGITYAVENRPMRAGVMWGLGALVKFFPFLGFATLWNWRIPGRMLRTAAVAIGIFLVGIAVLWLVSPQFTQASLQSQGRKGSWETIWALVDGNLTTGNFGNLVDRLDARLATRAIGNPPRISPWVTLPPFVLLGVFLLRKSKTSLPQPLAAVGLAFSLFFLWSQGWSVQWVLFLIPIILLGLEKRHASLLSVTFILVNVLEWPLLLSRGLFNLLPVTVLFRTTLFILSGWLFGRQLLTESQTEQSKD